MHDSLVCWNCNEAKEQFIEQKQDEQLIHMHARERAVREKKTKVKIRIEESIENYLSLWKQWILFNIAQISS